MKILRLGKRAVVVAALGFVAALLVVPGAVSATLVADVIPPGTPPALNILPSTVKGAMPLTGVPGQQQYLATLLYSYGRSPQFWQAVAAQSAGTATAGQITLVQQANGSFGVPATKPNALVKTVGGVGTAITGYSIGAAIGNGTLDLIGFDAEGAVCTQTTGVARDAVALLTGVDCSAFVEMQPEFVPNLDAASSGLTAGLCAGGPTSAGALTPPATGSPTFASGTLVAHPCSAGYVYWRATTGDAWQIIGHAYVAAVAETTPGNWSVTTDIEYYGTPSGGITGGATSWIYTRCVNGSGTGYTGTLTQTQGWSTTFTKACATGVAVAIETRTYSGTSSSFASSYRWVYTPGSTLTPPQVASGDPLRVLRCVVVHSGGSLSLDSATFRETDGVLPQVVCPDTSGLTVESIQVLSVNLEDGSSTLVWSEETTPEYQEQHVLAPECADGTCLLDLRKEGESCFQAPESCAEWFADPDKESTYSCHYGTHAVDLAECTVYAPTFNEGAVQTGNVFGDPDTGATSGAPAGSSLGTQQGAYATGVQDPSQTRSCLPQGWAALNPIEWVMRPVQCALEWAFVPRASVVDAVGVQVVTAWNDTAVAQVPEITTAWIAALPEDVGGCQGPSIDFGPVLEPLGIEAPPPSYPLSACEPPFDTIALIANVFTLGAVGILGAYAIVRNIAASIGYIGPGKDGSAG